MVKVPKINKKEIVTEQKVPLKGLSTFKTGGVASHLFRVQKTEDLFDVIEFSRVNKLPVFILGGGSNVLFSDQGFLGIVVKMENKGIKRMEEENTENQNDSVFVTAGAGEEWDRFVEWSISHGFFGLENLSGIPGTVGASPIQNIGAYGVEAKEYIYSVEVFDTKKKEIITLLNSECKFGYRDSLFKKKENNHLIITSVTFRLNKKPRYRIEYKDLKVYFGNNTDIEPKDIRDAVLKIRAKKFPDLNTHGTAGSFFKNIICDKATADKLLLLYPDTPVFNAENDKMKIGAAYVLDKVCGLKNYREGNVGLFENQSLVLVNYGGATTNEIKDFVSKIKDIVKLKTGIELKEEVVLA